MKIDATEPTNVIVEGSCIQAIKRPDGRVFNHSWPIGFDFSLRSGKIASVNRRVYPW